MHMADTLHFIMLLFKLKYAFIIAFPFVTYLSYMPTMFYMIMYLDPLVNPFR
jgi:hypothetical protein